MPIPFLPFEIIQEIASHFRTSPSFSYHDQVAAGKAISLVCRSWFPIGQALRWNKIVCGTYHISSLSAHFDRYPDLPRLVLELEVPSKMDEIDRAPVEELEKGRDLLPDLLNSTPNLRTFDLTDDSGVFTLIFPVASRLNSLRNFKAVVNRLCVWTPEMISLFNHGFPSLQSFSLSNPRLSLHDPTIPLPTISPHAPKKKLHNLGLEASNARRKDTHRLVSHFLSMTDINSLRSCTLRGSPLCSRTLEWLSDAPKLRLLEVSYDFGKFAPTLPTLLEHLPNLVNLDVVKISMDSWSMSVKSPIPIQSLLSALPANLHKCDVRQLYFDDCDLLEARKPQIVGGRESYCVVEVQIHNSWGPSPLLIWKGKGGTEDPWRRYTIRAGSWRDFDVTGEETELFGR